MGNFEIAWYIYNFDFCWHKTGEWLESPLFEIDLADKAFWRLWLYPRGEDDGEYISCYLCRENGGPEVVDFDFELLLSVESIVIAEVFFKNYSFEIHHREGHARLASRSQIFFPKAYQNDMFILKFECRILKGDRDALEISYRNLLTRVNIERISGTEIFEVDKDIDPNCNKDIEVKSILEDKPLINISLSYIEDSLVIKILPVSCKEIKYAVCEITLIKSWREESPIEHVRYWIGEIKADIWRYRVIPPNTESSMLDFKTSSNTTFFLHYDFSFSTGEVLEKTEPEYYEYVTTLRFPLQEYFNNSIRTAKFAPTALDALKEVYKSGYFVDLLFKSDTITFSTHKAILCARSPILKSIMSLECTEVKLIPLEDCVGRQLLRFLYTDKVGLYCLSIAGELYPIASFLNLELLKTKCKNFLRDKINLHHVIKILHILLSVEDCSLKSAVEDFVVSHYDLVIQSMDWEALGQKPELRREIILLKYKNKNKKKQQIHNFQFEESANCCSKWLQITSSIEL